MPDPLNTETEHRVELDQCWLVNHKTGATRMVDGLRIRWRFIGERRWRKRVLIPDEGQTIDSLYEQMDTIVGVLARQVRDA